MPNLKDIRRRIRSVKNTQKITQAMRMVAAAKVKRAEAKMKASWPYTAALSDVFSALMKHLATEDVDSKGFDPSEAGNHALSMLEARPVKRVAVVIIASDRGLCGAFNSNLLRLTEEVMQAYKAKQLQPKVYLLGSKIAQVFEKRWPDVPVLGVQTGHSAQPALSQANAIMDTLLQAYANKQIDQIDLVTTRFISMLTYKAEQSTLFPVSQPEDRDVSQGKDTSSKWLTSFEVEPSPQAMLGKTLPMYFSQTLYAKMLESAASELAARMAAMASATDNAKAMIHKLTLQYNKARQAAITQEIMEIVGGAEALT
jgi:F-type H+-transporting ATPase subunit gamma